MRVLLASLLLVAACYAALVMVSLSRVPPASSPIEGRGDLAGLNVHPAGVGFEDPKPMLLK